MIFFKSNKLFLGGIGLMLTLSLASCSDSTLEQLQSNETNVTKTSEVIYDPLMEDFAKALAANMADKQVRSFVKSEALKKFDGDFDIIYQNASESIIHGQTFQKLISEKTSSNSASKSIGDLQSSLLAKYPLLNISVPRNISKWDTDTFEPLVAIDPLVADESTLKLIKAYDKNGKIHWLDAQKAPDFPVVVVGLNERTILEGGKVVLKSSSGKNIKSFSDEFDPGTEGTGCSGCPTYTFSATPVDNKWFFLTGMSSPDISYYESWVKGAPEITMIAYAPTSANNFTSLVDIRTLNEMQDGSREDITDNNWWTTPHSIVQWNSSYYGKNIMIYMYEVDSAIPNITLSISGAFKVKLFGTEVSQTLGATVTLSDSDDQIGKIMVEQSLNPPFGTYYDIGAYFNVKFASQL
ncbi:DUF3103 family protein [Flectobacillus rivi]|uniref:DUF3103 family protein n=1 Tax=Flectobacillus rivi TaxID=2984209 RepID=A0ABT6YW21_9BACT|nr:DUF3103 family protein [Flectobacillus rivi]MDI9873081.1 DUF3103 family protein [Flectobacillus rivi]